MLNHSFGCILFVLLSFALVNPSAAQNELLLADDFEVGDASPSDWIQGPKVEGVKHIYDSESGFKGERCLGFEKSIERYLPVAFWSRQLTIEKQEAIQVSTAIKAENAYKAVVAAYFYDENKKLISFSWLAFVGAKQVGDDPVSHDWKNYVGEAKVPAGTKSMEIALQMWGPGKVWFDALEIKSITATEGKIAGLERKEKEAFKPDSLIKIKVADAEGSYLLVGGKEAGKKGLVIVLPGGNGSADFHPFVRNIHRQVFGERYVLAQPVAKKWTDRQQIVWPTSKLKSPQMGFTTEQLVNAVIQDVKSKSTIDEKRIYILAWSSGGPAAYACLMEKESVIKGGILAMSVFRPDWLPDLENGKDKSFYLLHSKEDRICPFWMAENAASRLSEVGARSKLKVYSGGHGWHGDIFGNLKDGISWLEKKD
ncbi:MAG: hypothetical protein AAF939_02565 [Planctomycetota bacterium]